MCVCVCTSGGGDIIPNGTDMQEQVGGRRDTEGMRERQRETEIETEREREIYTFTLIFIHIIVCS